MESSHGDSDHLPEAVVGAAVNESESEAKRERRKVLQRLKLATLLCVVFFLVEVVGGLLAGSLAILSDAAHLFSDFASFAVAIFANYLASMPSTEFHTFGLKRSESLAALFSMVSLALVCVWLGVEAVRRLYDMTFRRDVVEELYSVDGKLMSGIATIGVLVNVALAFVLGEHHVHMPGSGGHSHDHDHGDDEEGGGDRSHSHSHGHGHGQSIENIVEEGHSRSHGEPTESSALLKRNSVDDGRLTPEHANEVPPPCSPQKKKKRNVNLHAA